MNGPVHVGKEDVCIYIYSVVKEGVGMDGALHISLHFYVFLPLFVHFLARHPYISFHFSVFLLLLLLLFSIIHTVVSLYSGRELSKHFLSRFGAKCFARFTVAKAALVHEIHFGSPEDIKRSVRI